jgi:hypothetical protein
MRRHIPAKEAAAMIVRGIERNTHRIFIGKDASMMDKLYRMNPDYAARVIANKLRALLPAQSNEDNQEQSMPLFGYLAQSCARRELLFSGVFG